VLVLIVEDDESIAAPLAKGLAREGFDVERVQRGDQMLARLAERGSRPDIVLLDLGLPDLDGFEVCRRVRADSDVPIIVVTARADEVDRVIGLELGVHDYIVKPFGFRELVARIRAVTRRRAPRAPDPAARWRLALTTHRLVVNMIECEAHRVCAELFPERVSLDEWGYPVIDREPIPGALLKHARRAVQNCPKLALILTDE
jgi:DNA-binding response OmpR family regulator